MRIRFTHRTFTPLLWFFLLCGCAARVPAGPASIFDPGSVASVGNDTVTFVTEIYNHSTPSGGGVDHDFPLSESVTIDSVSGTWSYYGLNGRCSKNNTAVVGTVNADAQPLVILDVQSQGQLPLNLPITATFPGGVPMKAIHVRLYDDLCHPTDFRIALVFHRKKP